MFFADCGIETLSDWARRYTMSIRPEKPSRAATRLHVWTFYVREAVCDPEETHLMSRRYRRVSSLNTPERFRTHLRDLGLSMNFDPDYRDHPHGQALWRIKRERKES